jgi:virginiamycin B lyase
LESAVLAAGYAEPHRQPSTNIRQILGRPGEVWLPESGTETISVIRTA